MNRPIYINTGECYDFREIERERPSPRRKLICWAIAGALCLIFWVWVVNSVAEAIR